MRRSAILALPLAAAGLLVSAPSASADALPACTMGQIWFHTSGTVPLVPSVSVLLGAGNLDTACVGVVSAVGTARDSVTGATSAVACPPMYPSPIITYCSGPVGVTWPVTVSVVATKGAGVSVKSMSLTFGTCKTFSL